MKINKVTFLKDYVIEIELSNRETVYYDFKPYLHTARFKHIANQDFFEKGVLKDNCCIYWDPVTELQDYEMLGTEFIKHYL